MKRFLSLSLSLVMLICTTVGTCFNAFALETAFGVDISEHNGSVSFSDLKDDKKEFVMIRLGWIGNGLNNIDKKFWENVKKAHNEEMNFGVYFYSYAFNKAETNEEVEFVLKILQQLLDKGYGEFFTLPVAFDLEDSLISNNCSKAQITENMVTFCDAVKNAGYIPMVYANLNWFTNYINLDTVVSKGYKIWYANWSLNPNNYTNKQITVGKTGVKADMWQYVDGEHQSDNYDKNIAYNTDELIKPLDCIHTYDGGKVTKQPTCTAEGVKTFTCTQCGRTRTEAIAKKAHTYKNYVTKATMSANGSIVNKCSVCGAKKSTTTIYKVSSVALSTYSCYYTGTTRTPSVTVKDSKGKTLKNGTDYTVTYPSGRINVGRYAVKITLKGNYSGSKTLYYNIMPKGVSKITKVTAKSKGFTVSWATQKTQTTGYQIQYSTSSKFTNAKTITMPKNTYYAKSITGLTGNKKYYVRIRTYKVTKFGGKNYNIYSPWCAAKSVTTKR